MNLTNFTDKKISGYCKFGSFMSQFKIQPLDFYLKEEKVENKNSCVIVAKMQFFTQKNTYKHVQSVRFRTKKTNSVFTRY